MGSDQPRRRSLVDKLIHRNSPNPDHQTHTTHDPETQDTTGLLRSHPAETRTITLPLEGGGTETLIVSAPPRYAQGEVTSHPSSGFQPPPTCSYHHMYPPPHSLPI